MTSYAKHLRGKHDQKDHGRRAIGGSGVGFSPGKGPDVTNPEYASILQDSYKTQETWARTQLEKALSTGNPREKLDFIRQNLRWQRQGITEAQRRWRAAARSGDAKELRAAEVSLMNQTGAFNGTRDAYNAGLSAFQRANREKAATRRRTRPPKKDTVTPSVSLKDVGLLGWSRQRPDTPPDYAQYDRDTERADIISPYTDRFPIRKLVRTPEGAPVRPLPNAEALSQTSRPAPVEISAVADNDVFAEQGSRRYGFWNNSSEQTGNLRLSMHINDYGSGGYVDVNGMLRGATGPRSTDNPGEDLGTWTSKNRRSIRQTIAALDMGMRPVSETIMVRRGVGKDVWSRFQQHLRVGDRFTDDAFVSTSVNPNFVWNDPLGGTINVILTEGTPALWTDEQVPFPTELEVVVGRGTTFEVISMDTKRGIVLRTIPPEGTYSPPPLP